MERGREGRNKTIFLPTHKILSTRVFQTSSNLQLCHEDAQSGHSNPQLVKVGIIMVWPTLPYGVTPRVPWGLCDANYRQASPRFPGVGRSHPGLVTLPVSSNGHGTQVELLAPGTDLPVPSVLRPSCWHWRSGPCLQP